MEWLFGKFRANTIVLQMVFSICLLYIGWFLRTQLARKILYVLYGYCLFHLGYLFRKFKFPLNRWINILISVIAGVVLWRCSCYKTLSIYENQIVTPDYYLFVSTIGYIFVGGLAQFVICSFDVKKCKLFLLIGKSTLYILLFHISIWTRILNPLVSKITNLPITSNECFSSTVGWGIFVA